MQSHLTTSKRLAVGALAAGIAFLFLGGFAVAQDEKAEPKPPEGKTHPLLEPHDVLNEFGVMSSSGHDDGGWGLAPELRVPEQYQYRRRDKQLKEVDLSGNQLPPVLTEMRVLSQEVDPGGEVRAIARVVSPLQQGPVVRFPVLQPGTRPRGHHVCEFQAPRGRRDPLPRPRQALPASRPPAAT